MPFPESQRVIYRTNPLEEVICQLRFPPILRIESGVPADFQEAIRNQYPLLKERVEEQKIALPPALERLVGEFPIGTKSRYYNFKSEDEAWTISLTRTFLALSTLSYARWEDFRGKLERPLATLHDLYKPSFYTRIGLRYRDVIQRSKLGLAGVEWCELLQPHVAGSLSDASLSGAIRHIAHELTIELSSQEGSVQIRHGLAKANGNGELCYVIDSDFYVEEKKETGHAIEILDRFNRKAGRLFRWCITKKLHDAMEPQRID